MSKAKLKKNREHQPRKKEKMTERELLLYEEILSKCDPEWDKKEYPKPKADTKAGDDGKP